MLTRDCPAVIMLAGDTHSNPFSIIANIDEFIELFPGQSVYYVIILGDFEFFMADYYRVMPSLLERLKRRSNYNIKILSLDGNHENHHKLNELLSVNDFGPVKIEENIYWLPRGYRWTWHEHSWLACGGAHSVDRIHRSEGLDWFAEEEISDEQEEMIKAGGKCCVMLAHDCPSEVILSLPNPVEMGWPWEDIYLANLHRERMQRIVDVVQPYHYFHGHYHKAYYRPQEFGYGTCHVTGLDWSGNKNNHLYFDTRTLEVVRV